MAVSNHTSNGNKATTSVKLPKEVFAVEVQNHQLIKDVYVAYMANGRDNLAKTLKRGEVRGGGKKPWRQKGTGRARVGSSRNPVWTGGGVTFGPSSNENYSKKVNAKAAKKALRQTLSLFAKDKNLVVIDDFVIKSGKTKDAIKLLSKLNSDNRTIVVVDVKTEETVKAMNNIQGVNLIIASNLSVYDTLNASNLVITKKAIDQLSLRLGGNK
jgi:large subunit ribosomal protein L4